MVFEVVFVKVFDENVSDKAVPGVSKRTSGLENAPKAGSWAASGVPSPGPGPAVTTKVTGIVVEPVPSVATRLATKDPASPIPISSGPGKP